MVKGTSRRVIVVDSPDTELFEQAIFIVRNDAMNRNGVTAQRLVDEACRVARTCGRTATCSKRSFFRRGSPALWCGVGAGGSFLLVVLSGLGFCQFLPLTPHKSCRLFRRRTCKVYRFLLSGIGVIFMRGGAGLFFRF